jgi:hypothetical protein
MGAPDQKLQNRGEQLLSTSADHILLVAREPGLRYLLREELKEQLACPVEACSPEELARTPHLAVGAQVAATPGAARDVHPVLPSQRLATKLVFASAEDQVGMVERLDRPSIIALVSVSPLFLETARGMLSPVVGDRHALIEHLLSAAGLRRLASADLVLCDSIAERQIKHSRSVRYRLVSKQSLAELEQALQG